MLCLPRLPPILNWGSWIQFMAWVGVVQALQLQCSSAALATMLPGRLSMSHTWVIHSLLEKHNQREIGFCFYWWHIWTNGTLHCKNKWKFKSRKWTNYQQLIEICNQYTKLTDKGAKVLIPQCNQKLYSIHPTILYWILSSCSHKIQCVILEFDERPTQCRA